MKLETINIFSYVKIAAFKVADIVCSVITKINDITDSIVNTCYKIADAITGGKGEDLIIISRTDKGLGMKVDFNIHWRNIIAFIIAEILSLAVGMAIGIVFACIIGFPLLIFSGYSIAEAIDIILMAIEQTVLLFI